MDDNSSKMVAYSPGKHLIVFGGNTALKIDATLTAHKFQTLNIELVLLRSQVSALSGREFDKDRPTVNIQLSEFELPLFAGVMLGTISTIDFKRPGQKYIEINRQVDNHGNAKAFVKGNVGSQPSYYALPIPAGEMYYAGLLALSRIASNHQNLSITDARALLDCISPTQRSPHTEAEPHPARTIPHPRIQT